MELYDYDAMDADDLIGEAKIDVKELDDQQERDLWLDIEPIQPEKGSHKVHCLFPLLWRKAAALFLFARCYRLHASRPPLLPYQRRGPAQQGSSGK